MRRLRLMSKEEQLLRETVRGVLLEVDKDIEGIYKKHGISLDSEEEHFWSSISSITDAVGILMNAGGPTFMLPNLAMDAFSLYGSYTTWSKESDRYNESQEALETLQLKNVHYEDVNGTPAIDPELLRKFDQYATIRYTLSSCLLLLSGIATIGSVAAMVPSIPTVAGGTAVEGIAKGGKFAIAGLQLLESEGVIDMAGGISGTAEKLKSLLVAAGAAHDKVAASSQHTKLFNEIMPAAIAIYQNPEIKKKLTSGAAMFGPKTSAIVRDLYACVDNVSDYRASIRT